MSLALLAAACGGTDTSEDHIAATQSEDVSTATTALQHHFGTTEVPVDGQRIVTPTQEQNALLPLLDLGMAWGKMDTFIAELERILLDPDLDVDVVDESATG